VRLAPRQAAWGYGLIIALAYGALVGGAWLGRLPMASLAALATLPLSLQAQRQLSIHAEDVAHLAPAIRLTLIAAHLHGAILAAALFLTKDLST